MEQSRIVRGNFVNTLKASCEEFVFVDQGLCKWILLASNSGTFAQNSLGNIRDYFIGILFELYAIKSFSEGFFCFRDLQFFPQLILTFVTLNR